MFQTYKRRIIDIEEGTFELKCGCNCNWRKDLPHLHPTQECLNDRGMRNEDGSKFAPCASCGYIPWIDTTDPL